MDCPPWKDDFIFQSTPSVWRETGCGDDEEGADHDFNPLPPCGGRQEVITCRRYRIEYFNPLPPCGGRLSVMGMGLGRDQISIHSLRVEGDRKTFAVDLYLRISIHSLRVEGDT